ncbi:MAG: transglutaminase-like domain-containing protein [Chitinophagaceae bacterium]|nr:transglutaminase-like domain-containing protein [Chitinophagaceae bacterium]
MEETKEIYALLQLMDDPDEEVYSSVCNRIISLGSGIIPNLEHLWETTPEEPVQERIEMLIHRLHLQDLQHDLRNWSREKEQDLLTGILLLSRYQYPDLNLNSSLQELEKIRRNVWLELNSFLTPLEQVNVLSNILYNYYKLKGNEVNYLKPDEFLLPRLIESKKGNAISIGLLVLVLSRMLDINLQVINIPRQLILGYFDDWIMNRDENSYPPEHIQFYLDGASGQIYSHQDVETYFKRISVPPTASYFKPLSNRRLVQLLLEEYAKCFMEENKRYKQDDLLNLSALLDENEPGDE